MPIGATWVKEPQRSDIRVTIDILVELSMPSRISMLTYGYPWPWHVRDTMDILVELPMPASIDGYSWKTTDIHAAIHTNTGARGPFELGKIILSLTCEPWIRDIPYLQIHK